eukprot:5896160-Alexandrium_andersonii.AAC.1
MTAHRSGIATGSPSAAKLRCCTKTARFRIRVWRVTGRTLPRAPLARQGSTSGPRRTRQRAIGILDTPHPKAHVAMFCEPEDPEPENA